LAGIRVIAGKAKGRKLAMVPGDSTRPVGDRVKEAFFNILGPDIEDSVFLDLFAGTGSVGIEALSRGAAQVDFIDRERMAIKTIEQNLAVTQLTEGARVLNRDAFKFLEQQKEPRFDYVYIAPPQYHDLWKKAVLLLDQKPACLQPDAQVVVQIHPREYEAPELHTLQLRDERKYGNTLLVFYDFPGT